MEWPKGRKKSTLTHVVAFWKYKFVCKQYIFRCVKSNLKGNSFEQSGIDERKKGQSKTIENGEKLVIICHVEYLHENDGIELMTATNLAIWQPWILPMSTQYEWRDTIFASINPIGFLCEPFRTMIQLCKCAHPHQIITERLSCAPMKTVGEI